MNQQNKIYGRAFCVLGLNEALFNGVPRYVYTDKDLVWRLNPDTLMEYNLSIAIFEEFIDKLQQLGTISDLRLMMGMQKFSGLTRGPVLRHSQRPEINCMVTIMPAPNLYGSNPNTYGKPWDIQLDCFIDVDKQGPLDDRELEREMNLIGALTNGGIAAFEEVDEDVDFAWDKEGVKNPVSEAHDFYSSMLSEAKVDRAQVKNAKSAIEKIFKRQGITGFTIRPSKAGNIDIAFEDEDEAEVALDILSTYGLADVYESGAKDVRVPYENIQDFEGK